MSQDITNANTIGQITLCPLRVQSSSIFINLLNTCYLVYHLNDFSRVKILFTIAMPDITYENISNIYK